MKKRMLSLLSVTVGVVLGGCGAGYFFNKKNILQREKIAKFKDYYNLLNHWLVLKNEGKSIEQYFINNNHKTIAVYGMGEMGSRFVEELEKSNTEIKYAIDKDLGGMYSNIEILDIDDDLEEVDLIVVTAIFAFDEITQELRKKINCPIISLEDVIYEL